MKQFKKIILSIAIFTTCLFFNSICAKAEEEVLNCSSKNILREKSTGEQVKILQKELISIVGCNLTVDGIYGAKTKICVREFQKISKLVQDGIVGPNTCKKLNATYLSEKEAEKNNQSSSKQSLDCKYTLAINSKGENVKLLQKQLNEIMGCNLTADGLFGSKTKACVINFQKQNKLTQDGIVGNKTCKKLNDIYLNSDGSNNNQEEEKDTSKDKTTVEGTLNCRSILKQNSSGEQVKLLQKELNEVMGCNLTADGDFGSKTKQCLIKFQSKNNLTADGVVGSSTCGKLNVKYLEDNNYIVVHGGDSGKLNVRQKANSSSKKLGSVNYGTVLKIYGTTTKNGSTWYKIKYNDEYAYVSAKYVNTDAIVVDISAQTVKSYINSKLSLDALGITGTKGKYDTPVGRYTLKTENKFTNAMLSDEKTYWQTAEHWLGIDTEATDIVLGFADEHWRKSNEYYNINTYITNGTHGWINLQKADAKALYNSITQDIKVYVVA